MSQSTVERGRSSESGIGCSPPARPGRREERWAAWLFRALAPRLDQVPESKVPERLAPYQPLQIGRADGGVVSALHFPVQGACRGAVLLCHPWMPWGQSYFFRRGRIEALRAQGYEVLTFDLGGIGSSAPTRWLLDWDVDCALNWLTVHARGRPVHLWGVSSGGYWAHPVLSRRRSVAGACFEDVAVHLLEWSWRMAPWGRPFYRVFRTLFPRAYAFMDLRRHAPCLGLSQVAYVGGEQDRGALPEQTRELAELAGGRLLLVPDAGHLAAIKRAGPQIITLALETFEAAESSAPG